MRSTGTLIKYSIRRGTSLVGISRPYSRGISNGNEYIFPLRTLNKYPSGAASLDDAVNALKTLRELCGAHGYEPLLNVPNGTKPLVNLLQHSWVDRKVQVESYLMLVQLTANTSTVNALINNDIGIKPYVEHLDSEDIRLRAASCLILGNITLDPENVAQVCTEETVQKLLEQVLYPHEGIQKAAISCIGNIATSANGADVLHRNNVMDTLVKILERSESISLRTVTTSAIGNMLSRADTETQNKIRENGGLSKVLLLLSTVYPEEAHEASAWTLRLAVQNNFENKIVVGEAGGIGLLMAHLSSANKSIRLSSIKCLHELVRGCRPNHEIFCRQPNCRELCTGIKSFDNVPECRNVMASILEEVSMK